MASKIQKFDIKLFEALQADYAARPERVPYVHRDKASMQEKARKRIELMQKQLDTTFKGKTVLELGCGNGWQTAFMPKMAGVKKSIGIDIFRYKTWDEHSGRKIKLIEGDLSVSQLVPEESVDVIVSGAVFEHVTRPIEMLHALYRTLRPGGVAWLYFNLHRGPRASHSYNEVFFPWPHLLFDDSVCAEFYKKHHKRANVGFSWVNRMTIAEYLFVTEQAGFEIKELIRRIMPIDVPFYLRFEDQLGRYTALDLESDFATLILHKPAAQKKRAVLRKKQEPAKTGPKPALPVLDYAGRQKVLNEEIKKIQKKMPKGKTEFDYRYLQTD